MEVRITIFGRKIDLDCIIVALIGLVVFPVYAFVCHKWYCTGWYNCADFLSPLMMGKDIFSGNLLLKNWNAATNSFYLLSFLYGFLGRLFGYRYYLLPLCSGLLFSVMMMFVSNQILWLNKKGGKTKYIKLLFSLALISISVYCRPIRGGSELIFSGSHFDAAICALLYLSTAALFLEGNKVGKIRTIIVVVFYVLGNIGDKTTMLFSIIPLFFVCFFNLVFVKDSSIKGIKALAVLTASFAIVLFSKWLLSHCFGLVVPDSLSNYRIISHKEFFGQIAFFIKTMCNLFGVDFWELTVSKNFLLTFFYAGVFCVLICSLFSQIKTVLKNNAYLQLCAAVLATSFLLITFMQKEVNMSWFFADRFLFFNDNSFFRNRL